MILKGYKDFGQLHAIRPRWNGLVLKFKYCDVRNPADIYVSIVLSTKILTTVRTEVKMTVHHDYDLDDTSGGLSISMTQ